MAIDAIDQQRREFYETAKEIAPTWEQRSAYVEAVMTPVREWMLRELSPQAGDVVLELAAGVGDTGFDVAAVIGERGRLISSDFSPAMLEAARRRGAERGLGNVDFRVIDAERPPEPPGPPVFSTASTERTTALLEDAGFSEVRTEDVPVRFEFPNTDQYQRVVSDTAGPLGLALRALAKPRPRGGHGRRQGRTRALRCRERLRASRGRAVRGGVLMPRTRLVLVALAVVLLSGADRASAFISGNTIDAHAIYSEDGGLLRVSGPIGCTRGERVSIQITVSQSATEARARNRWKGRCRGNVQHWQVRSRARRGTRFGNGRGRVCAVAKTRSGARVTDTRRWCERVDVVASRGRGRKTVADEVCFRVNNLGDPVDSTIRGTLFRSNNMFRTSSTALLLQHGAVSERTAWSGGAPVIDGTHDTARSLAGKGYSVFAIDRLGYGESHYERPAGSGSLLTPDGYIEMTHQMVTQIRAGSYTDCAGEAAGRGAAHVVLSGFSSGAAIVEGYATRYHDIEGIIPMSWSNQPELSAAFQTLVGVLVPQLAAGQDYIELIVDGADGYSEFCERAFFYVQGVRSAALEQLCGLDYYAQTAWPTPSGEAANIPALQANTVAKIRSVGPTPVLLVFSDRDTLIPGAVHRGADPDVVTPEIAMWRSSCNCDVSVYIQRNAGHVGLFHKTSKQVARRILAWLHDHELAGKGRR